jgi:hypothetical protein
MANDPATRISTRARVTVTVSFSLGGGGWGEDSCLEQVYKQAARDAENLIRSKFGTYVEIENIKVLAITNEMER